MKVLLLHDKGTATGGAERQFLAHRAALRAHGHDARLLATSATPIPNSQNHADYVTFGTNNLKLQAVTQTVNPAAYHTLRRVLRQFDPDIVHVRLFLWQLSPLILPLLRDRPALYQTSMYKAICPTGKKLLPNGTLCHAPVGRACLRCLTPQSWLLMMGQHALWQRWQGAFDRVVALSSQMAQMLRDGGVQNVCVVHNGVAQRAVRPPLSDPPTVIYAGRLEREKGVDVFLAAVAMVREQHPALRVLIVGEGAFSAELQKQSNTLNLSKHVQFLGYLTRAELEALSDSAWVQVVPSLWAEPFGNVTTEAMMRGTAVIASAVGGQLDIVDDGKTGYLIPPNDVDALVDRLLTLLADKSHCEAMGMAGRERALACFSEQRRTEDFLQIYDELLRERAA